MATPSSLAAAAACYCFDDQRAQSVGIYLLASKAGLLGQTPAQLAASAKCYCYNEGVSRNVSAYLLAVNAGVSSSTPSAIASSAACYCYDDATFRGISVSLLASIAGSALTPSALATAAICYCYDEQTARSVAIYLLAVITSFTGFTPSALASLASCFCFNRGTWKKVVAYLLSITGGGPPPPQNPAFGAEVQRWSETTALGTTVITLTGGIALNNTVVLPMLALNTAMTISGVSDSRGNTYIVRIQRSGVAGDNMTQGIATAQVTTALQIGDTITITWNNPAAAVRMGAVDYFTNVTAFDNTMEAFGTLAGAVSAPGACAANSVQLGFIWLHDNGPTVYSGSAWTPIGGAQINLATLYYVQHVTVVAGSQDPAGSINNNTDWSMQWVSMK